MITVLIDAFHWDSNDKTFSVFHSDIQSVYAITNGIRLKNPKTNGTMEFTHYDTEYHHGDIVAWHYKSDSGIKVIIFND
jgi:hypothetical protein